MRAVSALLAAGMLAASSAASAGYGEPELLFTFKGSSITESSGIAQSSYDPDLWWTHNDSGENLGRFFAVGPGGFVRTQFALRGSLCADWEDMAVGPGEDGGTALYFADIGDNPEVRGLVQIYEVPEPVVQESTPGFREVTPERVHVLAYEDGPHNAETFLVDPRDGSFAIVTKDADGSSGLYVAPPLAAASQAPRLLRRVADLSFPALASQPGVRAWESTGGDVARDGSSLIVRTYLEAFEWTLGSDSLAVALSRAPDRIPLPATNQGEAIAYTTDGTAIVTSSEGLGGPVHRLTRT